MKKITLLGVLIVTGSLLLAHFLFADTEIIYVTKKKANIKKGPDETIYKTVAKVKYRAKLEVLEVKGDWYKVKVITSGKVGWIYKGKISKKKPERDTTTGEKLGRLLRGKGVSETAETAATAGIREFKKGNYQGLEGDFEAVRKMETLRERITDKEVIEFLRQGNLK